MATWALNYLSGFFHKPNLLTIDDSNKKIEDLSQFFPDLQAREIYSTIQQLKKSDRTFAKIPYYRIRKTSTGFCIYSNIAFEGTSKKIHTAIRYTDEAVTRCVFAKVNDYRYYENEVKYLTDLKHSPNAIHLFDFGAYEKKSKPQYFMVLEMAEDNLENHLKTVDPIRTAMQLLKACCGWNFIHRDLKPDNILLTEEGALKVCDFAFAHPLNQEAKDCNGSISYMPPEILNLMTHPKSENIFKSIDDFAIGVILYRLFQKEFPDWATQAKTEAVWAANLTEETIHAEYAAHPPIAELTTLQDKKDYVIRMRYALGAPALMTEYFNNTNYPERTPMHIVRRMLDPNPKTRLNMTNALIEFEKLTNVS